MSGRPARTGQTAGNGYPTRVDVARLAGTSTAVVSYVVNNGPRRVSPSTRARVQDAMRQLGYRPNALARSLRARRTRAFGLVVPDLANPFFGELAKSVEDSGFESGEALLVGNSMDEEDRELHYVRTFLEYRVDGLIVVPVGTGQLALSELRHSDVPVVVLDRYVPGLAVATILPENVSGAREATRHLLDHGHDNVACLAGPEGLPNAEERVAGWARALDEARVPEHRRRLVRAAFGRNAGYLAARRMLSREPRPRALFVASDEQAFGALRAAAQVGARVPGDLAIVGFDGLQQAAFTVPGLTTMRQPIEEAAALAVKTLLEGATTAAAAGADPAGADPARADPAKTGAPAARAEATDSRLVRLPVAMQRRGSCGCAEDFDGGDAGD